VLGQADFVAALQPLLASKAEHSEIPRQQRAVHRPRLETLFRARGADTRATRDHRIGQAHLEYGYSLTAIGQHLGLHYTTISKIIKRQQQTDNARSDS
jgi:putative transposase